MKRFALYSSSRRSVGPILPSRISRSGEAKEENKRPETAHASARIRPLPPDNLLWRHYRASSAVLGNLLALLLVWRLALIQPSPQRISQKDIERAVMRTLQTQALPSSAAKVYEIIKASVLNVRVLATSSDDSGEIGKGVGTGVVILDEGLILTSLHVVAGAKLLKMVFADGLESEAEVMGIQPTLSLQTGSLAFIGMPFSLSMISSSRGWWIRLRREVEFMRVKKDACSKTKYSC